MRIFEVVLRSGAKAAITAEIMDDQTANDDKIYFYRDNGLKQLAAYFNRADVVGIVLGPDHSNMAPRPR
jgi:hypothetical protein